MDVVSAKSNARCQMEKVIMEGHLFRVGKISSRL